jgi:hypothetical protein
MPASVETPCDNILMPRLTGKSSEMTCLSPTTMMVNLSDVDNHLECSEHRNIVDLAEEAGSSAAGSVLVTAEATTAETANLNDEEEEEEVIFQYEKVRTHLFLPSIAEAKAVLEDIKKILKPP